MKYVLTGNKVIDMVAACVEVNKQAGRRLAKLVLNRQYYAMYWAGAEILSQTPLPVEHDLQFEGIPIRQGNMQQVIPLIQFYEDGPEVKNYN